MLHYRKIYEQHYGPIPKDEEGRTYEVHHIDNNRENNSPENLIALSIQEHYDIHYAQGNWYACLRIAEKMKLSPQEISELARKNAQKRIEEGTHNFQTRPDGTSLASDRVNNGTNPFLGGKIQKESNQKRINDGTHPFLGGEIQRKNVQERIENGSHHFLGEKNPSHKRINDGTHHLLGGEIQRKENHKRVTNGDHNFLGDNNPNKNMPQITCPYCGKTGGRNAMKQHHFDNCKKKGNASDPN